MGTTTKYHVRFDDETETWRVEKDGSSRASAVCDTREEAIAAADDFARKQKPSVVTQHLRDTTTVLKSGYKPG